MSPQFYDIFISASKLAAFIGRNKYCKKEKIIQELWRKIDSNNFEKALTCKNIDIISVTPKLEIKIADTEGKIDKIIKKASIKVRSSKEIIEIEKELNKNAKKAKLSNSATEELISQVRCAQGCLSEKKIIDYHEKKSDTKIINRNTHFYKKKLTSIKGENIVYNVYLCGKPDGVDKKNGMLVEVKRRMNRLFSFIPEYERIQMHAYMFLSGIPYCKWIQSYEGKQDEKVLQFDNNYWNILIKEIVFSCELLIGCLEGNKKIINIILI